jgi:hypothetical protein
VGANIPGAVDVIGLMRHVSIPTLQIDGAREFNEMAPGYCKGQLNVVENRLAPDMPFFSDPAMGQTRNRLPLKD